MLRRTSCRSDSALGQCQIPFRIIKIINIHVFPSKKSHSLDSLVNRIIQAEESWKFLSGTVRPIPLQIIFILWEKYYSFSVPSLAQKYLILVTASQSTLAGSLPFTCRNILFCNLHLSSQDISCSNRLPGQRKGHNKLTLM